MRRLVFALLAALGLLASPAQARLYTQPELDALVAPIALYPDGLISDILVASTYPDQVEDAARLAKDEPPEESWSPSVKSLLSFPDILQRMVENPRWTSELGEAFLTQEAHVLDTVQALRRRAQQQGTLKSDERQVVTQEGAAIVVQPRTEVVYAPYYDPLVVYGGWWWPAYYPVYWRPWVVAPVVVAAGFWYARPVWHHRHVVVHKHGHHHGHGHVHHGAVHSKPYHSVQEGFRKPIVSSTPQMHRFDEHRGRGGDERRGWNRGGERRNHAMPAAPRFSEPRPQGRPPAQQTQQPRVHAPQRQPRAQAPQQQPRAHTPQHQPRAHVPQHQPRASAPQQPRFGAQQQGGGHRSGGGGGGGHRSNGGGGRSGRG